MLTALTDHIATLIASGVRPGDIGVLLLRNREVSVYAQHLIHVGFDSIELTAYEGKVGGQIKVGTVKRAKGLEFAHVLLPELTPGDPAQWRDESDEAYAERVARYRRELFVAMTRARDGLWLGHLLGGS